MLKLYYLARRSFPGSGTLSLASVLSAAVAALWPWQVLGLKLKKHHYSFEGATKFADSRAGRNPGKTSCFPNT